MPRHVAAMIAAVLALAAHTTVVALDRSPPAFADNAWLIIVDDLHIDFVNTGHLRTLLRAVASELIHDGDLFELRATGPSTTTPLTANRDLLAPAIKGTVGNGLKSADTVGAISGSPASNEVLYRANVSLTTAADALTAFVAADGRRKAIIYVSRGYDLDAFQVLADRVTAFARRSREAGISIFAIDARGLAGAPLRDPRVDPAAWLRHTTATRRGLTMMAEQTGGFVIQKSNEPADDLVRIERQMR